MELFGKVLIENFGVKAGDWIGGERLGGAAEAFLSAFLAIGEGGIHLEEAGVA